MTKKLLSVLVGIFFTIVLFSGCGEWEKNLDQILEREFESRISEIDESESVMEDSAMSEPESEENIKSEEASAKEAEHLQEYLDNLKSAVNHKLTNEGALDYFKCSYYADDINSDGYPELFMLWYRDYTATVQEMYLYVYSLKMAKQGTAYEAMEHVSLKGAVRIDTLEEPKGGVEVSYTSDGKNVLVHTYSIGSPLLMDDGNYLNLNSPK